MDGLREIADASLNHSTSCHSYYIIFAELYSLSLRKADVLMVNSTWTNQHINHLLKPFGWRDDADEEDEEERAEELCASSTAVASAADVDGQGESAEDGLRRRKESWKKVDERKLQQEAEEEKARQAMKVKFRKARTVYPPCDTLAFASLPLEMRENIILSVAQFRSVVLASCRSLS